MFKTIRLRWEVLLAWCCCGIGAAFADLPRPKTLYRLRRVGYEILNDGETAVEEFPFWTENLGLLVGVACLVFAVVLALSFRRVRLKVARFLHGSLVWLERKLEYVVLSLLCISALVGAFYLLKLKVFDRLIDIGYGKIYASGPGWKYPDQVSDKVRAILMNRLNLVKDDLQKAVDSSGLLMEPAREPHWQVAKPHYARERMAIMTKVLSESEDLRRRCRGIPIEWLVDSIHFHERVIPNHTLDDEAISEGSAIEAQ